MHDKYKASLDWLFFQFPAFQTQGALAYKPGLENTFALLKAVGNPQEKLKFIHVAGTNGKGSTCSYLASLLKEKGYKTGLFTSPHIFDFRERIRINGETISEQEVIEFCDWVKNISLAIKPSFFEITFVLALKYFAEKECEFIILETGLGGRLDATNTVQPLLSIITRIGLDHQQFLGETLPEIASEKAGIIKQSVPVIIGQKQKEVLPVFIEKAKNEKAPIYLAEEEIINVQIPDQLPDFQQANLRTAIVALDKLGISLSNSIVENAIKNLNVNSGLFGRLQKVQDNPTIWFDASHNEDGIMATLQSMPKIKGQLHILYGASSDKNCEDILTLFPEKAKIHCCTFTNPRSKTLEQFEALKSEFPRIQTIFPDVNKAIEQIKSQLHEDDALWVTGSFFLLSDIVV